MQTIAQTRQIRVTDDWGEPTTAPEWRRTLTDQLANRQVRQSYFGLGTECLARAKLGRSRLPTLSDGAIPTLRSAARICLWSAACDRRQVFVVSQQLAFQLGGAREHHRVG